jgi:hypothetical protein
VTSFYKLEGAKIITDDGEISGTSTGIGNRYIKAQVVPVGNGLPSQMERTATSETEFREHEDRGYDVGGQRITLTVNRPTYIGESLFSTPGYVEDPSGTFHHCLQRW